jgi:lipopolysaccharide transport system permease protein
MAESTTIRSSEQPQGSPREWALVIRPHGGWFDLHLKDLWTYRDLVWMFVRRDFVSQFKQTVMGPAWFVLQPLLTTVVFAIVFGNIAQLSTDGLPKMLFYLSGNVVWLYFSGVLTTAANTFVGNAHLFGKVYFPRLSVPLSLAISHLFKFLLQFVFLLAFVCYYWLAGVGVHFTWYVCFAPLLILLMGGQALGLGVIFSSLTTKYRDLRFLLEFGVRLMMYAAPVVYPLSAIPDNWRWVLLVNPMTPIIEIFRLGFLGQGSFVLWQLAYSIAFTLLALLFGAALFNRVERTFMDTV